MRNRIKPYLAIFVITVTSVGACSLLSEETVTINRISVNNDTNTLNQRVEIVNEQIDLTTREELPEMNKKYDKDKFIYVANVKSPMGYDYTRLSATSVDIRGHKVFVSYHKSGNAYGGALDIIDVKDHSDPKILSTILFDDTDINALEVENNGKILWLTGGRDVHKSGYTDEGHSGAILGEIEIDKDVFESTTYREVPLPSYSGNAVVDKGQHLYVASGATGGGFYELDKSDLKITGKVNHDFAKYVDRRNDDIVGLGLSGNQSAGFSIIDFKKQKVENHPLNVTVNPVNGKNVIEHFGSVTYAALGDQGVRGYRFYGSHDPLEYQFKGYGGDDVANGVTVDGKYVYIANGTDGIYITTHAEYGKKEPYAVYSWYCGKGSVNFVKTDGEYIIIANGVDGLNILRRD